ncbi:WXG100 family type VII secretion target [Saccharopolyspora shandongensis]|uniref:WXG100 family type VII secretion target n=1 Tax=Saccharopolyspora shandongensis TaxID=418495 RepID=UPI0033D6F656
MAAERTFPALGFDPARGDVATVRELARQATDAAGYAKEAHEALKAVQSQQDVWQGQAAKAFAEELGELPKYIGDAHSSLEAAGKALSTWSTRLQEHQAAAAKLEAQAKKARATYEGTAGKPEEIRAEAWDALNAVRGKAENLQELWEDDGRICAKALREAAEKAPAKAFFESFDGLFSNPGEWFDDHIGDLGDIAGLVSAVSGYLVLYPPCTIPAASVMVVTGLVALGAHSADMVINDKFDDPASWISVGGDVLGVIPGFGAIGASFKGWQAFADEAAKIPETAPGIVKNFFEKNTGIANANEITDKAYSIISNGALSSAAVSLQANNVIGLFDNDDEVKSGKDKDGFLSALVNALGNAPAK